jgi:hypothetical protein
MIYKLEQLLDAAAKEYPARYLFPTPRAGGWPRRQSALAEEALDYFREKGGFQKRANRVFLDQEGLKMFREKTKTHLREITARLGRRADRLSGTGRDNFFWGCADTFLTDKNRHHLLELNGTGTQGILTNLGAGTLSEPLRLFADRCLRRARRQQREGQILIASSEKQFSNSAKTGYEVIFLAFLLRAYYESLGLSPKSIRLTTLELVRKQGRLNKGLFVYRDRRGEFLPVGLFNDVAARVLRHDQPAFKSAYDSGRLDQPLLVANRTSPITDSKSATLASLADFRHYLKSHRADPSPLTPTSFKPLYLEATSKAQLVSEITTFIRRHDGCAVLKPDDGSYGHGLMILSAKGKSPRQLEREVKEAVGKMAEVYQTKFRRQLQLFLISELIQNMKYLELGPAKTPRQFVTDTRFYFRQIKSPGGAAIEAFGVFQRLAPKAVFAEGKTNISRETFVTNLSGEFKKTSPRLKLPLAQLGPLLAGAGKYRNLKAAVLTRGFPLNLNLLKMQNVNLNHLAKAAAYETAFIAYLANYGLSKYRKETNKE